MSSGLKFKVNKPEKASKSTNDEIVKLDHRSHILKLPETYTGSLEKNNEDKWYFNDETNKIEKGAKVIIPGEYKIFDEIIVNAFDQYIRTEFIDSEHKVKNIRINVNLETGNITIKNDGEGIKVEKHSKENVYIPELIFGHLLTSSNYTDAKIAHVGGKNGYGAKLTNIFSKEFLLETIDHFNKKKYKQRFYDNMSNKDKPSITSNTGKPYTMISYTPDYPRFNSIGLTKDMFEVMKRRAYDLAACTGSGVNVYFNDSKIECKTFDKYVDYYLGSKSDIPRVYEKINSKWEIVVAMSSNECFEHISFVNGIFTNNGGKHVDYVTNQITKKLAEYISKKKKINVKTNFIKENIIIFIKCLIDNPSFNSQTKDLMTTNKDKFGSKCEITDKMINNIAKIGIIEKAIELTELKESKALKTTDGKKQNRIKGLPKLDDAIWAGQRNKSEECTLILTEGDSAKAMAMAGMSVVGRHKYGVFPLKGKILNVKDGSNAKKILENAEISNIKKALGLQSGRVYKNLNDLRYGKILVLADQDEDGTHIKGLVFNLFHSLWPSLYNTPGFLNSMLTPVIKAKKGKNMVQFYSVKDYDKWKGTHPGFSIKYYKGLGTSTPEEARTYFKEFKHVKYLTTEDEDNSAIELAFSKNDDSANNRKIMLSQYDRNITLDYSKKTVSIKEFVYEDLIHFFESDNIRSLPSAIDGLKPSQRKVLYCSFKRNLVNEIRVAQLAGYVSEHGAYHHGEASLQGTIVNMAQDYVGSNNCNLLEPIGQFGTRLCGGKDSAQPRYIHTKLSPITSKLFNKFDEPLYEYTYDDGQKIEPVRYVPTMPLLLINGSEGIGTGWSTNIPPFNPTDILKNIKLYFAGIEMEEMYPYFRNFKGTVYKNGNNFYSKGIYSAKNDVITITELPIGVWSDKYKEYLEGLIIDSKAKSSKQIIRYYNSYCSDVDVHFEITMDQNLIDHLNVYDDKIGMTKLEKALKIVSSINTSNMVAFDRNNKIKKYENVNEIMIEYIETRLELYNFRKKNMMDTMDEEIKYLSMKIRFIKEFISGEVSINNQTKQMIIEQLETREYSKRDDSYDYLLRMPIYNLTKEKIDEFDELNNKKNNELELLKTKTEKDLWTEDFKEIEELLEPKKKIKFMKK
jgi:DNA topoisomerase-2